MLAEGSMAQGSDDWKALVSTFVGGLLFAVALLCLPPRPSWSPDAAPYGWPQIALVIALVGMIIVAYLRARLRRPYFFLAIGAVGTLSVLHLITVPSISIHLPQVGSAELGVHQPPWVSHAALLVVAIVALVLDFKSRPSEPAPAGKVLPQDLADAIIGTWRVRLTSDYSKGEAPPEPLTCYLVVRSLEGQLSCRLLSLEASSDSTSIALNRNPDGSWLLSYTYLSSPKPEHRARSQIHDGAAKVRVSPTGAGLVDGEYWTSRRSGGALAFVEKSVVFADSFDTAEKLHFLPMQG